MHLQKRTLIAFLILLIFLALQISVNYPNPRLVREIKIKNETSNQYLLILGLPEQIWFGQSEKIIIQLLNDNYQNEVIIEQQEQSDFDSRKIQNFEVDFVLTSAELTPSGIFITPIIEGKDIIMNWRIEPTTVQDVIGTVWIYINTFSDVNEEENQRELIFTKNLSIKIKNFFGLKIGTIQLVISLFIVLNIIYLFRSYHLKKKGLLGVLRRAFARLKTPCP